MSGSNYLCFLILLGIAKCESLGSSKEESLTINITTATADIDLTSLPPGFLERLETELRRWNPVITAYLKSPSYNPPNLLIIEFQNCSKFSSASHNFGSFGKIWACISHFQKHPDDLGSFLTTLIFIIQNYNTEPRPPLYVTYGIDQYVKVHLVEGQKTFPRPRELKFSPTKFSSNDLAYYLNYVNAHYPSKTGLDLVQSLNWEARDGKFNETFWAERTGKDMAELWEEMILADKTKDE